MKKIKKRETKLYYLWIFMNQECLANIKVYGQLPQPAIWQCIRPFPQSAPAATEATTASAASASAAGCDSISRSNSIGSNNSSNSSSTSRSSSRISDSMISSNSSSISSSSNIRSNSSSIRSSSSNISSNSSSISSIILGCTKDRITLFFPGGFCCSFKSCTSGGLGSTTRESDAFPSQQLRCLQTIRWISLSTDHGTKGT
ncbi:hypothetical protein Emag_000490 [Eimeria magna]